MTVDPTLEQPRPAGGGESFTDAVTFAFGDAEARLFGLARSGLSPGAGGAGVQASGLGVLFAGREPVAVRAAGGIAVEAAGGWPAEEVGGVAVETTEPLRSWRVRFSGDDGRSGFDLRFDALSDAGMIETGDPAAKAGGMTGYEQLCRVTGVARVGGEERRVDCLGQRGHAWGAPDWDRIALARTVSAWPADDLGVSLTSVRPAKAKSHADEAIHATLFAVRAAQADGTVDASAPLAAVPVAEPRLTTTTDADGLQRRAGLELYEDEDGYPHRAAGEVMCGTSLDLGRLRLDCAFFRWRMAGRVGVGRYDVLRRVA